MVLETGIDSYTDPQSILAPAGSMEEVVAAALRKRDGTYLLADRNGQTGMYVSGHLDSRAIPMAWQHCNGGAL
jgi:hypothetical protein